MSLSNIFKIVFKEVIGTGYYGIVLSAVWRHPEGQNVDCAVKALRQTPQQLMKEITSLQKLRHANIVQLYGVCLEDPLLMVDSIFEDGPNV